MTEPTVKPSAEPTTEQAQRARQNTLGIVNSLISGASFQGANGAVRFLSADFGTFEMVFLRNLFGVILLMPMVFRAGLSCLRTNRPALNIIRCVLNFGAMLCMFTALSLDPLAKVVSIAFTTPLFVTLGAALFLGEKIYARRIAAIAIGFAGMLLILRPGFAEISEGTYYALGYVVIWAAGLLCVKMLARTESSITLTVYAAGLQAPMALVGALFVAWTWPTLEQYGWFFLLAAFGSIAQFTLSQAFRLGDAGLVLSVDYGKLVWAALIGYVIFGEVPTFWTWVGGAVICSAVSYIAYRERAAALRA